MAYPFFSLAKSKRLAPIDFKAGSVKIRVEAVAEHGMATIWDADVLIWAASQIVEAENHGLRTSRFFRFTPYQLLRGIGRDAELRRKATPTFQVGCKRILRSNDWYPALARPNVDLVTDGIDRITATGVVTKDGTARDVDVIVVATGFRGRPDDADPI